MPAVGGSKGGRTPPPPPSVTGTGTPPTASAAGALPDLRDPYPVHDDGGDRRIRALSNRESEPAAGQLIFRRTGDACMVCVCLLAPCPPPCPPLSQSPSPSSCRANGRDGRPRRRAVRCRCARTHVHAAAAAVAAAVAAAGPAAAARAARPPQRPHQLAALAFLPCKTHGSVACTLACPTMAGRRALLADKARERRPRRPAGLRSGPGHGAERGRGGWCGGGGSVGGGGGALLRSGSPLGTSRTCAAGGGSGSWRSTGHGSRR
jgi:hypothetical protein